MYMIHVGKWGRMHDDGQPSDDSFVQRQRRVFYNFQRTRIGINTTKDYFSDFIKKDEKYSDELKEEILNDFKDYLDKIDALAVELLNEQRKEFE